MNEKVYFQLYKILKDTMEDYTNTNNKVECWDEVLNIAKNEFEKIAINIFNSYYEYDPQEAKAYMYVLGDLASILAEGKQSEISDQSIVTAMIDRIKFLADDEVRCWVNVYERTRRYGGPEEGGWYYDWDKLVESHNVPYDEAEAKADTIDRKGEGDISSVLGGYQIHIRIEGSRGESKSRHTPHYE